MLRYVGAREATVWVEVDGACEVEVLGRRVRSFLVQGHHYALVVLRDLEPGGAYRYEVALDGRRCWPPAGQPPSVIRTVAADGAVEVVFGSCRRAAPDEPPWSRPVDDDALGLGRDALILFARRLMDGGGTIPDVLLMGGDQVYSDLPSPATLEFIRSRRSIVGPHDAETADFAEYAFSYRETWGHHAVRWLLSTVPTAMIFDDHDVHNGWNSSQEWVEEMAAEPGWPDRVTAGLAAYWVYQHLGNLSPAALAHDEVWRAISAGGDVEAALHALATRAARMSPGDAVRWSYRWDLGPVRLVVVDSRSARILAPGQRDMLPPSEWEWVEDQLSGGPAHLLVATSVPVLLPRMVHHLESWSDRAGAGAQRRVGVAVARRARGRLGLEHWPAFPRAFDRLLSLLVDVAAGRRGPEPASVVVLSGEVHYSYVAELADTGGAPVVQVVSSPLRNPSNRRLRFLHRLSATATAAGAARILAASAGARRKVWRWRVAGGPWFDNGLASVRVDGADALVRFETTASGEGLAVVDERRIAGAR